MEEHLLNQHSTKATNKENPVISPPNSSKYIVYASTWATLYQDSTSRKIVAPFKDQRTGPFSSIYSKEREGMINRQHLQHLRTWDGIKTEGPMDSTNISQNTILQIRLDPRTNSQLSPQKY